MPCLLGLLEGSGGHSDWQAFGACRRAANAYISLERQALSTDHA